MKAKMNNSTYVEGYIYEHTLEERVSGPNSKNPGTPFIMGNIVIATDDDRVNLVTVHYTYITQKTSKGTDDSRYAVLKNIIDGKFKTIMQDGAEQAAMVRISSSIGLNEFYSDRDGVETLVSAKRNEGGFIHTNGPWQTDENKRNTFDNDIIITSVKTSQVEENGNMVDKVSVSGYTFDFRKALLPVTFSVTEESGAGAMAYFEGLGVSQNNPVFTRVKGVQVSSTVVKTIEEESAFGAPSVREVTSTRKDWIINWAQPEVYEWDSDNTITVMEFKEALAARATYEASIKQRQDEWKASQNNKPSAFSASATTIKTGDFKF